MDIQPIPDPAAALSELSSLQTHGQVDIEHAEERTRVIPGRKYFFTQLT